MIVMIGFDFDFHSLTLPNALDRFHNYIRGPKPHILWRNGPVLAFGIVDTRSIGTRTNLKEGFEIRNVLDELFFGQRVCTAMSRQEERHPAVGIESEFDDLKTGLLLLHKTILSESEYQPRNCKRCSICSSFI